MPRHRPAPAADALAVIHAARLTAGPAWPNHDPIELARPTTEAAWLGVARSAHARRAAGVPLTTLDREALDRYPDELDLETHARLVEELADA